GRWYDETTGSAVDHISETDDGTRLGVRLQSAVAKTFLTHFRNVFFADVRDFSAGPRVLLLLKRALVEVVNERGAMVILNDVDDALIELILERKIDALLDVRDDDQCAHRRGEIVMRIAPEVHVFGKVFRFHQF